MSQTGQADSLIAEIRGDLRAIEERLLQHDYLRALEDGRVSRESLRVFAGEQYAVIGSDLRSVAHLVSRFGDSPSRDFFFFFVSG